VEESRVLVIDSVSEGGRSWVIISLEEGKSSPNLDATEGHKHTLATVSYLEFYYLKYSRDPGFKWNKQILVEPDKALLNNPVRSK
jgi:hypothetical protein